MFTCFAQVYWLRLERRHQVWVVRNIVQVQQHRTVDQNQFTTESKNKTVEHMSSLLDGSIWAVTPNLERSTRVTNEHAFFISLTSYYRENLKKKIMHSTTFNPAGLEAMYTAESMLQRVCCLYPRLTLYCIEMEIFSELAVVFHTFYA